MRAFERPWWNPSTSRDGAGPPLNRCAAILRTKFIHVSWQEGAKAKPGRRASFGVLCVFSQATIAEDGSGGRDSGVVIPWGVIMGHAHVYRESTTGIYLDVCIPFKVPQLISLCGVGKRSLGGTGS